MARNVSFYGQSPVLAQANRAYITDPTRAIGLKMMREGSSLAPVQSPTEGLARALTGATGGYFSRLAREQQEEKVAAQNAEMQKILMALNPTPATGRGLNTAARDGGGYSGPKGVVGAPAKPGGINAALAAGANAQTQGGQQMAQALMAQKFQAEQQQRAQAAALDAEKEQYLFEQQNKNIPPKKPDIVKTAEGVFILNPDGTLGTRLGGAKPETEINFGSNLSKDYQPVYDEAGNIVGARPITGGKEDPLTIAAKEEAKKAAAQAAKNEQEMPGLRRGIQTKTDRLPLLQGSVNEIKELAGRMTTSGLTGQVMGDIAGSDQYVMNAKLEQIKSAIGLQELIDVKAQGATFGSLTENEMSLLISSVGSLDANLPPEHLNPTLDNIVRLYEKGLNSAKADFKERYPDVEVPWETPKAEAPEAPDLKKKYGLE